MLDLYMICTDLKNSQSGLRQKTNHIILEIYKVLNNPTDETREIIEGWKSDFRYVYGDVNTNLSSNNKLRVLEILNRYHIKVNGTEGAEQVQLLFYAVQTYFSVLVKVMMREILFENTDIKDSYEDVILGRFAVRKKIMNYCNPDWYSWPVFEMSNGFDSIMNQIQRTIEEYRSQITLLDFAKNTNYDYIKQIYEAVIPKELRHALGEYYTPDWLAEEALRTAIGFKGTIDGERVMDPTCGSGTFLFKAIIEKRKCGNSLEEIIHSVSGIDMNPLAVLTAKTNYLLAVMDLIDGKTEIEIPVYHADVIQSDESEAEDGIKRFAHGSDFVNMIHTYAKNDRKKAFAQERADMIVGNPPWVNWEYMPVEYRISSQHLWIDYMLFNAKGRDLSFSKEDISVLITYIVIDKLLKTNGILAFVIRQGVFKSAQNGVGFRRFKLKDECDLKVLRVDDLSRIKAFDNAVNSVGLVYLKKGETTKYPVRYTLWEKRADLMRLSFHKYSELREVKSQIIMRDQQAMPAVDDDITSIWLTAFACDMKAMHKVLGKNRYKARTGVFTGGANAVYWLKINGRSEAGIEITNVVERAKRKSEKITRVIEADYVYPMLKGANVKRWNVSYDTYLLCPHTEETKMWPVSQERLRQEVPETFGYLCYFKDDLDKRKGFAGWEREIQQKEFQAILRIGDYTFSHYKVVWKYIASEFICAVIGDVEDEFLGDKILLPNEKIMYISTDDEDEAYYLCGILSSTLVANCVKSYMNPTSISAHVLDKLCIPDFDRKNDDHLMIAKACRDGHGTEDIDQYISEIDSIVARLYQ